jgi:hypothetical protein
MRERETSADPVFAVQQQLSHFGGERGKGRQPAEESGDGEQADFRREVVARREERHGKADEVSADEV